LYQNVIHNAFKTTRQRLLNLERVRHWCALTCQRFTDLNNLMSFVLRSHKAFCINFRLFSY